MTWVQGHWEVENRLHWVRDVTFDEDCSQVRTGNSPRVMASLCNTAITLLRIHGTRTSPPRSDITPATPPAQSTCS
ncbi:hypothetical protein T261_00118 [Streptomyces lydicus]|nr:hypothetical protein T261_00118 [Streptomyces lydicus]